MEERDKQGGAHVPPSSPDTGADLSAPGLSATGRVVLTVDECLAALECLPGVVQYAKVVGKWVWLQFPEKPEEPTRAFIKRLGFRWNRKREAWQNPCGIRTRAARGYDPRDKYGVVDAESYRGRS